MSCTLLWKLTDLSLLPQSKVKAPHQTARYREILTLPLTARESSLKSRDYHDQETKPAEANVKRASENSRRARDVLVQTSSEGPGFHEAASSLRDSRRERETRLSRRKGTACNTGSCAQLGLVPLANNILLYKLVTPYEGTTEYRIGI